MLTHFVVFTEYPVCEDPIASYGDFCMSTTNCYASVSCDKCRRWIWDNHLKPLGFLIPVEWRDPIYY